MNDPLRQLVANRDTESVQDEVISVEEAIDCRLANSRFFSLIHNRSLLNVIIATDSSIISAKLGGYEIVVNTNYYNEQHETWAIGEKPYQKLTNLNWNSHVRGSELILSSLTGNSVSSSLIYELSRQNELICLAKLKSIYLQQKVLYFNLNPESASSRNSIDGHIIAIRCNASLQRIQVRPTRLLCNCNKFARVSPQALIGDIPYELRKYQNIYDSDSSLSKRDCLSEDDFTICDAIYSLESTCTLDFLQAHLQFDSRILVVEIQSVKSAANVNQQTRAGNQNSGSANNVTSSSRRIVSSGYNSPNDLMYTNNIPLKPDATDSSHPTTSTSKQVAQDPHNEADLNQVKVKLERLDQDIAVGESLPSLPSLPVCSPTEMANAVSHSSAILRLRVRITNFGVCIMPYMMTNYSCSYRFAW